MTSTDINLVKQSWKLIKNIDPVIVGDAFYSKLFSDHPSLRKLFPANMQDQYLKLVSMLKFIVTELDNPDDLNSRVNELAQRHVQYKVKAAHYAFVGQALLWTLRKGLGKDWTPAVEAAWINCYNMLAGIMIEESSG